MDDMEEKINLRFSQLDNRVGSLQRSMDYLTALIEQKLCPGQNSSNLASSILTISAENDMNQRLKELQNESVKSQQESEKELNDLKIWAGNDEDPEILDFEPEEREEDMITPTGSMNSFFDVETQNEDVDSELSFAIIPSMAVNEQNIDIAKYESENEERTGSVLSSASFECIDSLTDKQSETDPCESEPERESEETASCQTVIEQNEGTEQSVRSLESLSTVSSHSTIHDLEIQEAVRKQSEAIKKLIDSQMHSSSSYSRTISQCSTSTENQRIRDEDTAKQIEELAADISAQNMIKSSAGTGSSPFNSRETSQLSSGPPSAGAITPAQQNEFGSLPAFSSFDDIPEFIPNQPVNVTAVNSIVVNNTGSIYPNIYAAQYIPPQPTPIPSHIDIPTPPQMGEDPLFTPETQFIPAPFNEALSEEFGMQIDLDRDTRALSQAIEPTESVALFDSSRNNENELKTLTIEFGAEYSALSKVALRKFDNDAEKAIQYMKKRDLPTQYLVAKLRLEDFSFNVDETSLAQLVLSYENVVEIISDYINHEYNNNRIMVHADGVSNNIEHRPNPWNNFLSFVRRSTHNINHAM